MTQSKQAMRRRRFKHDLRGLSFLLSLWFIACGFVNAKKVYQQQQQLEGEEERRKWSQAIAKLMFMAPFLWFMLKDLHYMNVHRFSPSRFSLMLCPSLTIKKRLFVCFVTVIWVLKEHPCLMVPELTSSWMLAAIDRRTEIMFEVSQVRQLRK